MSGQMSKFQELCRASERASAAAQAAREREAAELERELQEARALARRLAAEIGAYFQCPEGSLRYLDLRTGETALDDLPSLDRDEQGFRCIGLEMGLTECRVQIRLTLSKQDGRFLVRLGDIGYPWPFPGSNPHCLCEELFHEISRGLAAGLQQHRLAVGMG
jgi:hypothetical protein